MKKSTSWLAALLILAGGPPALRAAAPPLFAPEPPEPAAAAMVAAYLPLLAAGQFEQALQLVDLRGLRQYLLDRRLNDLRAKNRELTEAELQDISAQLQVNELNPARLQAIQLDTLKDADYAGLAMDVVGYAPAPEGAGYLVSVVGRAPDGREKPILLGLKKLGEEWLIAPEIVEELGRRSVVAAAQPVPPPAPVVAAVDAFWKRWQAGDLDEAYALHAPEYRQAVPLLAFLQQAQELIAQIGAPTAWKIVQCRPIAAGTLGLGVDVQGPNGSRPTIMVFRKQGESWILVNSQTRMPTAANAAPAGPAAPAASPFRTDLKPSLKPVLPAAEPTPAPAAARPAPAQPDAPIGPDAP
ncbi:MAG TPA: hypothetical protein P5204_06065 [Kiritimatiellia bacterium]|nr:hypothetical protein [Kiritimatiellia bacterium]